MSVLTKLELIDLAKNQKLLGDDYKEDHFEPSSYDLRIGTAFQNGNIYRKDSPIEGFNNTLIIKPSEIITFLTLEIVNIPNNCIGTVFAINQLSSTGLLILNPGHIDPGFKGTISVCAINLSKEEKRISIEDKIFSLVVQKLTGELEEKYVYKSKFTNRKKREEEFNKNTALQLSNSFFDLISTYKSTPYFREQVLEVIKSQLNKAYGIVAGIVILLTTIGGFLINAKVINLNNPFKLANEKKDILRRYDSLYTINSNIVRKLEDDNRVIKDSLIVLSKKLTK